MPDLRQTIQAELDRRGWTVYRLIQEHPTLPTRAVYRYLSGGGDIRSETASRILDALGLRIVRE